ncbi:transmembrane proteins 14C-domain-containing protein [Kalaharituber pfeilii]|nr:transmembrane proteins 14C-domain-containing protein [Kalaharituber pfeilii]
MSETPALILGLLCGTGGVIGYLKTGSVPSIVAGVGVGALYTYSSFRIRNNQPYGIELAILASVILAGSSIPRAIKTKKPLPSALSLLAATGLLYYCNVKLNQRQ